MTVLRPSFFVGLRIGACGVAVLGSIALFIAAVMLMCAPQAAAETPWLYGRIKDVHKSVTTNTKVWVANTPINEEITTYLVAVVVGDKQIAGTYELHPEESPPPPEWVANYPVKVQLQGDNMFVRSPMGDVRLHVVQRKNARAMTPLTDAEKKQLEQIESPAQSLVGFSSSEHADKKQSTVEAPQPVPAPAPPVNVGTVNVRSTPYLSEVFVDGDSMGYTPAKINLPPGKHTFRVEKPGYKSWTKEMTVTVGSELTLDASLERK